jgi:hypothetical protein
MSEWWTYTLSDFLLFSPRTYYRLLELYNLAIWPAQLVWLGLGIRSAVLLQRGGQRPARTVAAILAGAWLWVAVAFHLQRFATINWAAVYYAAAFVVQAALLVWLGVIRGELAVQAAKRGLERAGFALFLFALFVYPLIRGHRSRSSAPHRTPPWPPRWDSCSSHPPGRDGFCCSSRSSGARSPARRFGR